MTRVLLTVFRLTFPEEVPDGTKNFGKEAFNERRMIKESEDELTDL